MSLLKTGACFTAELELNCPTIVACVAALPIGPAAVPGATQLLGTDGQYHVLPAAGTDCAAVAACVAALPVGPAAVFGATALLGADGQYHTLPTPAVAADTQDLSIAGNVISLTNGGSVTLPTVVVADPYATPAQTIAGTATALIVNPADLYARENIAAQTGLSNNTTAIPAPTASQSVWGQNLLGETLHYSPALGWQIVDKRFSYTESLAVTPLPHTLITAVHTYVAPRTGVCDIQMAGHFRASGSSMTTRAIYLYVNGVYDALRSDTQHETIPFTDSDVTTAAFLRVPVVAGDVLEFRANQLSSTAGANQLDRSRFIVGYTK
jgi:hypothetical protein